MAQGDAHPEQLAGSSTPAAEGALPMRPGDASTTSVEERLRREIAGLREELNRAANAYQQLNREVEKLKRVPAPMTPETDESSKRFYERLAPLSKINGRRSDLLRTWFEMVPIYL